MEIVNGLATILAKVTIIDVGQGTNYVSVTSRGTTKNWQTHHVYSTLKQRGNGGFHAVSMWNTRDVLVGKLTSLIKKYFSPWKNTKKAQRHS